MEHKTVKNRQKNKHQHTANNAVDFYSQPEFMQLISQQLAEQSAIDFDKIANIKQAIEHKTFTSNPLTVAEKMIQFETELFDKYPKN